MILEAGRSKPKTNKVAWFGNIKSAGASRPEHKTRPHLVNHYGKRYPDRFKFSNAGPGAGLPQHFVSLADQTREYKYLLDIGGNGYSARLKFLLFSGRPTMVVERDYVEYFWDDLKPYEHYIPVKMDLSDLVEQHQWAVDNDKAAVEIAENARDFAIKNFTMDKAMERFQEVFQNFKRLQA